MDIVNEILNNASNEEKYKPITVEKHLDLDLDLGTLLAKDNNDLDAKSLRKNKNSYLLNLTRDNTQILFNSIWELPTERIEEAIVARLPAPVTVLPRSLPVPKPRPLTKWEKFAKEKGIVKTKKRAPKYDQTLEKWVPNYGYKSSLAEKQNNWVMEVPQNADPNEDQFAKAQNAKKERVAKNELQRLKNIARAKGAKIPRAGLPTIDKASAKHLSTAASVAKASTASLGKFQSKLPKEKGPRGLGVHELIPGSNRKRKPSHISDANEKSLNLSIVDSILNKRPKIDIEKAVSRHCNQEQLERSEEKSASKKKAGSANRKKSGKTSLKGRGASKPKAGKGQRNPKMHSAGRKRR